jgi:hypothetical protein
MKTLAYTIAALACLAAAPVLITPAAAQVTIGIGNDGPRLRAGSGDYRGSAYAEDRGWRYGRSNRDCRDAAIERRQAEMTPLAGSFFS